MAFSMAGMFPRQQLPTESSGGGKLLLNFMWRWLATKGMNFIICDFAEDWSGQLLIEANLPSQSNNEGFIFS